MTTDPDRALFDSLIVSNEDDPDRELFDSLPVPEPSRITVGDRARLRVEQETGEKAEGGWDTARGVLESVTGANVGRKIDAQRREAELGRLTEASNDEINSFIGTSGLSKWAKSLKPEDAAAIDQIVKTTDDPQVRAAAVRKVANDTLAGMTERKQAASERLETGFQPWHSRAVSYTVENAGYMLPFAGGGKIAAAGKLTGLTKYATQAALPLLRSGVATYKDITADTYDVDDDGNVFVASEGDSGGKAALKASANAGREVAIEMAGGAALRWVFGKAAGKFVSSGMKNSMRAAVRRMNDTDAGRAVLGAAQAYRKISEHTQFHGFFGEMFEEEIDLATGVFGLDKKDSENKGIREASAEYWGDAKKLETHTEIVLGLLGTFALHGGISTVQSLKAEKSRTRAVDNALRMANVNDETIAGMNAKEKDYLYEVFIQREMEPEKAAKIMRRLGARLSAAADEITEQEGYRFDADRDGIKPNFKIPGDIADDGHVHIDPASGIGLASTGDGSVTMYDPEGGKAEFASVGDAVEAAKQRSVELQVLGNRRANKMKFVGNAAQRLAGNLDLDVFDSVNGLVQAHPELTEKPNFDPRSPGVRLPSGKIALVLDNIRSPQDALRTIMHEAGIHEGLRKTLGSKEAVEDFAKNVGGVTAEELEARAKKLGYSGNKALLVEEGLAHAYENRTADPSTYQDAVSWLRGHLRKVNPKLSYSDSEIEVLMWEAQQSVMGEGGAARRVEVDTGAMEAAGSEVAEGYQRRDGERREAEEQSAYERKMMEIEESYTPQAPVSAEAQAADLNAESQKRMAEDPQAWIESLRAAKGDIQKAVAVYDSVREDAEVPVAETAKAKPVQAAPEAPADDEIQRDWNAKRRGAGMSVEDAPAPTPERVTRHRVFEGGSPIRVSNPSALRATDKTKAYRLTSQSQVDDMLASGGVRAREGKMKGGHTGEVHWSAGHETLGYAPRDGAYVIETSRGALNDRAGILPNSDVRLWRSENGTWTDVSSILAPTPQAEQEAPAAPAEVAKPTKGKGFTHATIAREYFFDSGAGAMKSTGYLFNAFAGAFPRAHTQLRDVLENHKASIDSTQDDIRTLVQTPEWGAIRADVIAAVEQAYGANGVEARSVIEEMLGSPTGVTVKRGKALNIKLDALEEKMNVSNGAETAVAAEQVISPAPEVKTADVAQQTPTAKKAQAQESQLPSEEDAQEAAIEAVQATAAAPVHSQGPAPTKPAEAKQDAKDKPPVPPNPEDNMPKAEAEALQAEYKALYARNYGSDKRQKPDSNREEVNRMAVIKDQIDKANFNWSQAQEKFKKEQTEYWAKKHGYYDGQHVEVKDRGGTWVKKIVLGADERGLVISTPKGDRVFPLEMVRPIKINGKEPWQMTQAEWDAASRFYRSGETKNVELPTGQKVIIRNEATPKNFLEVSKDFLGKLRNDYLDAMRKRGKDVPVETVAAPETPPATPATPAKPTEADAKRERAEFDAAVKAKFWATGTNRMRADKAKAIKDGNELKRIGGEFERMWLAEKAKADRMKAAGKVKALAEAVGREDAAAVVEAKPAQAVKMKMDTILAGGRAIRARMTPEQLAVDDQRGEAIKEVLKRNGSVEEISKAYDSFEDAYRKASEKTSAVQPTEAPAPVADKVAEKWTAIKRGERVAVSNDDLDQIEKRFEDDPDIRRLASTAFSAKSYEAFLKPIPPREDTPGANATNEDYLRALTGKLKPATPDVSPTASAVKLSTEADGDVTVSVPSKDTPAITPKEQKKFLLAEIDKAIGEAPDVAEALPRTKEADEAQADYLGIVAENYPLGNKPSMPYNANDDQKAEHADKMLAYETQAANKLDPLFEKYGIPEMSPERKGYLSLEGTTEGAVPESKYDIGERYDILKARLDALRNDKYPTLTIEVPGDGEFTVINDKSHLSVFRDMAKKRFPASMFAPVSTEKKAVPEPHAPVRLGRTVGFDAMTAEIKALLQPFASKDQTRKLILNPHWNGAAGEAVATDGRRLAVMIGKKNAKPKKDDSGYPNYTQVIPGYKKGKVPNPSPADALAVKVDSAKLARKLTQALSVYKDVDKAAPTVNLWLTADGTLEVSTDVVNTGSYSSLREEGDGFMIGIYNPEYLMDALTFLRKTGNDTPVMYASGSGSPMVMAGKSEYVVQMPIRMDGTGRANDTHVEEYAKWKTGQDATLDRKGRTPEHVDSLKKMSAAVKAATANGESVLPKPKQEGVADFVAAEIPQSPDGDYQIYITKVKTPDGSYVDRFAVPDRDHKNKPGFGDSLHATLEEAVKEAQNKRTRDVEEVKHNAEADAAKREAAEAKAVEDDVDGFDAGMTPMQRGKAIQELNALVNIDGNVTTRKMFIRRAVKNGTAKPEADERDVVAEWSRTKMNRASQAEQDAYKKRREEGGKKTVYLVGGYNLGHTAFKYANHLIAKSSGESALPKPEAPVTSTAQAPEEQPLPNKGVQHAIDRSLAAASIIRGKVDKKAFESAYSTLRTHADKIGVEVAPLGTYFNADEYRRIADAVTMAIAKKYGSFPTEELRAKRDAANANTPAKAVRIIPYKDVPSSKIKNMDAMPRGTGARYLEVTEGENGDWIAKQWRRTPVTSGNRSALLDFDAPASAAQSPAKLEDFGEKIGGARKDVAGRGFTMSGKKAESKEDDSPAWRKQFIAAESVSTPGQWTIIDKKNRFGGSRQKFSSQAEAEAAIPLYAVAQKHTVYQNAEGKWEIYKRVGDRKRIKVVNKLFDAREEAMTHMAQHAEELLNLKTSFGEEILPVPEIARRSGVPRRTKDATPEMFMDTFAPRGIEFGNWNNQEERQMVMNHAYDGLMDLAETLGVPPKALMLDGDLAIAFGARGHGLASAKAHYELDYGVINLTKMSGAGSLAHEWMHALDHYLARLDTKASSEKKPNKRGDMVYPVRSDKYDMQSHGYSYKSKMREELKQSYRSLVESLFRKAKKYVEDTTVADKFLKTAKEHLRDRLNDVRADLARDMTGYHKSKGGYSGKPIKFFHPASAEQLAEFDRLSDSLVEGGNLETAFRYNTEDRPGEKPKGMSRSAFGRVMAGRHTNDTLESISAIVKAARNRSGFMADQNGPLDKVRAAMTTYSARIKMMESAESGEEKERMGATDYAIEARKMDQARSGDYWSEPHEMVARAFASYVEDKIAEKGGASEFLVYHAHGGILLPMIDGFVARPYPEGKEREAINGMFDTFIKEIQTKETDKGVAMFRRVDSVEPVFFSQLRRTLEAKMPNRMTVMALRGMIDPAKGSGVKADEIEWTGLKDFLDGKNPGDYVTKAEVLEAVRDVEIREVVKGAPTGVANKLPKRLHDNGFRVSEYDGGYRLHWYGKLIEGASDAGEFSEDVQKFFDETEEFSIEVGTKFEEYQLAGGENYRELLLTLPTGGSLAVPTSWNVVRADDGRLLSEQPTERGAIATAERLGGIVVPVRNHSALSVGQKDVFKSSHFSEPNILAHVRFNERQAANGDKTLFLEEVQSDWMQAGRDKGFIGNRKFTVERDGVKYWVKDSALSPETWAKARRFNTEDSARMSIANNESEWRRNDAGKVPDAPFKDTSKGWARLAFKRMLRWGAENGFDRVAWTTGEQQAERYDLSKQVSRIEVYGSANRTYNVFADDMSGKRAIEKHDVPESELAGVIGKELAQKVVASPMLRNEFTGLDFKVGGEGMRTFYDQILPSIANDIGKKFGARVGDTQIANAEVPFKLNPDGSQQTFAPASILTVHSLPVTPAMRDSVMQGQPMFRRVTPEQDAAYLDAVQKGDMKTAQRMVAEAAKKAGATHHKPKQVSGVQVEEVLSSLDIGGFYGLYPESEDSDGDYMFKDAERAREFAEEAISFVDMMPDKLQVYRAVRAATREDVNLADSGESWTVDGPSAAEFGSHNGSNYVISGEVFKRDADMTSMVSLYAEFSGMANAESENEVKIPFDEESVRNKHIITRKEAAKRPRYTQEAFEMPNGEIKSADAVTYDDAGNVIPLSERFNEDSDDTRFRRVGIPVNGPRYTTTHTEANPGSLVARFTELHDAFRTKQQDYMLPAVRLYERVQRKAKLRDVPRDQDFIHKQRVHASVLGAKAKDIDRRFVDPMTEEVQKAGMTFEELHEYAAAVHAPFFNRMIEARRKNMSMPPSEMAALMFGEGLADGVDAEYLAEIIDNVEDGWAGQGLSDENAAKIVSDFEAKRGFANLKNAHDLLISMNRNALETRVNAGLMSRAQADTLLALSPFYVPLHVAKEEEDGGVSGGGRNLGGREFKRAVGHFGKENVNSVAQSIIQAYQAEDRALENEARRALADFLEANPDDSQYVITGHAPKKAVTVKDKDGTLRVVSVPRQDWGMKKEHPVVTFKRDGSRMFIEFRGERKMAVTHAVKGDNVIRSEFLSFLNNNVMRFFKVTRTALNPEFFIPNISADFGDAMVNLTADGLNRVRDDVIKQMPHAWKIIFEYNRGHGALEGKRRSRGMAEAERFLKEAVANGMMFDSKFYNDTDDVMKDLEKRLQKRVGGKTNPMSWLSPREDLDTAGLPWMLAQIDRLNSVGEMGTRLSIYMSARKNGMGVEQAVELARNVTVDFHRKGEWTPVTNTLYAFSNVGIQATYRMGKALLTSKSGHRVAGGLFAAGFLSGLIGALLKGDDDDEENGYGKLEEWWKQGGLVLPNPFTGNWVRLRLRGIPAAIIYAGMRTADTLTGYASPMEAAVSSTVGFVDSAFNFLGTSGSIAQLLMPTLADPFIQSAENKDAFGNRIAPASFNKSKPDSEQYRKGTSKGFVNMSRLLNSMSGGDRFTAGGVDVSPETLRHWTDFVGGGSLKFVTRSMSAVESALRGEEMESSQIPIVRSFVFSPSDENRQNSRYYEAVNEFEDARYRLKGYTDARDRERKSELIEAHPYVRSGTADRLLSYSNRIKKLRELEERTEDAARRKELSARRLELQTKYIKLMRGD